GRVDSPPTSRIAAPSAARSLPWAIAAPGSSQRPPSEKESGVTLTMPMTRKGGVPVRGRSVRNGAGGSGVGGDTERKVSGRPRRGGARALGRRLFHRQRRRARRLLRPEDLLLGLAGQQRLELVLLDGLALDEDLGDRHERVAALGQDVLRALVRALDDPADL